MVHRQDNHNLNVTAWPDKESFADPKMKYHFLDVCYVGQMKSGTSVRISILFEHKSSLPDVPVHFQLLRYISLLNYAEIRHNKKPSVVFPILLYHGKEPWKHISVREYYGELTHEEFACVPKFEYHVVDVSSMTEVELERIPSSLRTFLYTLFLGVRPELVLQKLKQTANFVYGLMTLEQWMEIYEIITAYLSSVSPEFEQKFKDMKYDFVTPAEKAAKAFETNYMAPRLREAHRKGLEEGIEKGIEQILKAYISHHLHLPDETIAGQFNVSLELVQRLREELSA
jgi:hypothetical protein